MGVRLSGNLLPGQPDVLILSITETGARMIEPGGTMNPLGHWWFGIGIAVLFTGLGWMIWSRNCFGDLLGDGERFVERNRTTKSA